jgi:integrase
LRHTHAALLLRQGVNIKAPQERLGHSTITTTLDIYAHVTPGMQKEAALRFEEALQQARIS